MQSNLKLFCSILAFFALASSCTPIKSSSKDEKHQMELTLHEVQTNVDDLRHDLNCFKTDLQIIDGKIKNQETQIDSVKEKQSIQTLAQIDALFEKIKEAEMKIAKLEKGQVAGFKDIENLSSLTKESSLSLSQCKEKLTELEGNIIAQSKRTDEVKKLKETLDGIATSLKVNGEGFISYRVKPGDSLEKIAKLNKTSVEQLKKLNGLDQDLIVVGQELKVPK
jgi:LysM repeat protein